MFESVYDYLRPLSMPPLALKPTLTPTQHPTPILNDYKWLYLIFLNNDYVNFIITL